MATDIPYGSSPERLMRLLWRARLPQDVRPGPRPRVTVDQVVEAAVARADTDGIAGLTMRALAADLGLRTMTLYTHVPDKGTLLALMTDHVQARPPTESPAGGGWRERVRAVVADTYRLHLEHPWLHDTRTEQPPLGPGVLGRYERQLAELSVLGLPDVTTDAVLGFVTDFARSAAADVRRRRRAPQSDAAWWAATGPLLSEVLDPGDFPLATRIGTAAGQALGGAYNAEAAYAFGLERVLDAVAALLPAPGPG